MDLAPVDAHAVPREAALLEVLAVVGGHDHQRVLEQAPGSGARRRGGRSARRDRRC